MSEPRQAQKYIGRVGSEVLDLPCFDEDRGFDVDIDPAMFCILSPNVNLISTCDQVDNLDRRNVVGLPDAKNLTGLGRFPVDWSKPDMGNLPCGAIKSNRCYREVGHFLYLPVIGAPV